MRLAGILVPFAVAVAAGGGVVLYFAMTSSRAPVAPSEVSIVSSGDVRHPVTESMLKAANAMSEKPAPFFKVKDTHSKDVQIGGAGSKPQFIYFILDGCPCSIDAQPLFNRMYYRYKDKVDFIGVIDTGREKALNYAGQMTVVGPIVCDEKLQIVRAFGAKESTYSCVVKQDGTVEKMWPGYSQDMLKELNGLLAKLTNTKEEPFDASLAPKKLSSGCFFGAQ